MGEIAHVHPTMTTLAGLMQSNFIHMPNANTLNQTAHTSPNNIYKVSE